MVSGPARSGPRNGHVDARVSRSRGRASGVGRSSSRRPLGGVRRGSREALGSVVERVVRALSRSLRRPSRVLVAPAETAPPPPAQTTSARSATTLHEGPRTAPIALVRHPPWATSKRFPGTPERSPGRRRRSPRRVLAEVIETLLRELSGGSWEAPVEGRPRGMRHPAGGRPPVRRGVAEAPRSDPLGGRPKPSRRCLGKLPAEVVRQLCGPAREASSGGRSRVTGGTFGACHGAG